MTDFNQKTHDTDVGSHGGQSRQMMEVFENQEFGSIRVLQEAGKTFFCASDVAKALGYVNPYAAVKRHCRGPLTKREGVVQKVNQYGDAGEQVVEIAFITEGDVYRLIVHSKLPSAERFEHWVFDEVLPSIRKHGVYMSDSILDQVIQHPEVIYTLAQDLVAEREQLEGIRKQLDAAQPKADYFDTFVNSEDCTCIRNFCKEIGIPEKTAVALLLDHRYLYRSPSGWLMPFADKSARGYFIVRDCYGRSGKLVQQEAERLALVSFIVQPIKSQIGRDVRGVPFDLTLLAVIDEDGVIVIALAYEDVPVIETGGIGGEVPFTDHGGLVASFTQ